MVFNPLEQERLSVVSLLVSSPHVRVFSEEGQPLAVQISAHWGSATDMVPDVYQVSLGARQGGPGPLSFSTSLPPSCLLPGLGTGVLGTGIAMGQSLLGCESA